MSATPDPLLSAFQGALSGQYAIERELGRGGFGVVYLARELSLDRPVALKVLAGTTGEDGRARRERLVREARMSARLAHPNIVPIHRVDEAGGFVFFAMGFVAGETLADRLRREGRLAPAEAARILRDVAWALGYAHAHGVVHCDVKPDNVFLDRDTGRTLVMDFGIAQLTREGADPAGGIAGTVAYMSPEQIRGEALDGRSDLYALGAMGYQLLTGRLPFDGNTAADVLMKHLEEPAPRLAAMLPGVPSALAQAIDRCLAKRADERIQSGEQFAEAIDAVLAKSRDVPPAVRVWQASGVQEKPLVLVASWFGLTAVFQALFENGPGAVQGLVAAIVCFAPLALLRLRDLRRLGAAGYGAQDIVSCLRRGLDERREELELGLKRHVSLPARAFRLFTVACTAVSVTLLAPMMIGGAAADWALSLAQRIPPQYTVHPLESTVSFYFFLSTLGALGAFLYPADRATHPLSLDPLRLRFWCSRTGARLVRLASAGRAKSIAAGSAATLAATPPLDGVILRLHRDLPRAARARLPQVPAVVRRLARSLRLLDERLAEIARLESAMLPLLAREATVPLHAVGAGEDPLAAVRQQATALADQRRDVMQHREVAQRALELLRLDLMRLRLGAATSAAVTTAVDAAHRVGQEIDALLHADAAAGRALGNDPDATLSLRAS